MIDGQQLIGAPEQAVPMWIVRNKIDLDQDDKLRPMIGPKLPDVVDFEISASRGDGVPQLVAGVIRYAQDFFGSSEAGLVGRVRQRELLRQTAESLGRSMSVCGAGEELMAEDLRAAAHSLGRLLGRVDVEDILDVIFQEFCIGK
jgi:tRNA modification GTPase